MNANAELYAAFIRENPGAARGAPRSETKTNGDLSLFDGEPQKTTACARPWELRGDRKVLRYGAPTHVHGPRERQEDAMTRDDLFELAPSVREKWPFAARYAQVNGWRMHYVDEGDGDPVLLLHGNPTWGFLYREVIGPLVKSGRRVIVPDMIGFGLSEKPTREQARGRPP
jgi:hypothetical protein